MSAEPSMPREVALPKVSADGKSAEIETGEILLLPTPLWQAIDAACELAGRIEDPAAARTAFAGAFAEALHKAGLLLIEAADPRSTQCVAVKTYSLALEGKRAAEGRLQAMRQLIDGWNLGRTDVPGNLSLLAELSTGLLAHFGRESPDEKPRLQAALLRIRALVGLAQGPSTGGWDLATAPALPEALVAFFKGDDI